MNPYEPTDFSELRDRPAVVFWTVFISLVPLYFVGMLLELVGHFGIGLCAACEATAGYFDCGHPWMKTYREFRDT